MDEILFWNKLNSAVASFCVDTLQTSKFSSERLVSTMVGDELEWCNTEALVSMMALHGLLQQRVPEVETSIKEAEKQLMYERETSSSLRKQIKILQLSAEDTAWELQEQLAHATNTLQIERDSANELKEVLGTTQSKLVEVEMFLSSERGSVTLQLEEELAAAKLKIAELEADKDELEIEIRRKVSGRMSTSINKSNSYTPGKQTLQKGQHTVSSTLVTHEKENLKKL